MSPLTMSWMPIEGWGCSPWTCHPPMTWICEIVLLVVKGIGV